jgi:hypothetical protein
MATSRASFLLSVVICDAIYGFCGGGVLQYMYSMILDEYEIFASKELFLT